MLQLSPAQLRLKDELECELSFRMVSTGTRDIWDPEKGEHQKATLDRHQVCDVYDRATGDWYASGYGASDTEALDMAFKQASIAPKPLTPAQRYERSIGVHRESAQAAGAEVARLKAELDAANAALAEARKSGRGRRETVPIE